MCQWWFIEWWLKQSYTWKLKQSDTCVNGGLLNDDTLIKRKWYLCQCLLLVYWMMILWLKQSDTCVNGGLLNDDTLIKESDTCVNDGLLNDDILIKTKWYLCQWWFIEWWYFD